MESGYRVLVTNGQKIFSEGEEHLLAQWLGVFISRSSYGDWHFGVCVCVTCDIKQNSQKNE